MVCLQLEIYTFLLKNVNESGKEVCSVSFFKTTLALIVPGCQYGHSPSCCLETH